MKHNDTVTPMQSQRIAWLLQSGFFVGHFLAQTFDDSGRPGVICLDCRQIAAVDGRGGWHGTLAVNCPGGSVLEPVNPVSDTGLTSKQVGLPL